MIFLTVCPCVVRSSRSPGNDCLLHCIRCIRSCECCMYRCRSILRGLVYAMFSFVIFFDSAFLTIICCHVGSRRSSMIGGGLVTATCMLTIGSLYATDASNTDAGRWSIIVLIYIFVIGFSCTWAIVTRIICSEIQPMRTRAAATSLGQCANWVSSSSRLNDPYH